MSRRIGTMALEFPMARKYTNELLVERLCVGMPTSLSTVQELDRGTGTLIDSLSGTRHTVRGCNALLGVVAHPYL